VGDEQVDSLRRDAEALRRQLAAMEQQNGAANDRTEGALGRLFELSHDMLGVLSYDGAFMLVNPAWERVLGYGRSELKELTINELLHPEDIAAAKPLGDVLQKGGEIIKYPMRCRRRDGAYSWLEWSSVCVPEERLIYTIARDVTEQREKESLIEAQARALLELSTPLIPITDRVVAMPLVGTLDTRRAQQVIDTLLEGIARTGAAVAILDITGVQVVDTQVANAILRAAKAVRLLGANVVLTGIRPEVAQTMVAIGVDLQGVVTRSTLQAGIAYATTAAGQLPGAQGRSAPARDTPLR
jgi:rsbT co-antagonist protein RsbR